MASQDASDNVGEVLNTALFLFQYAKLAVSAIICACSFVLALSVSSIGQLRCLTLRTCTTLGQASKNY